MNDDNPRSHVPAEYSSRFELTANPEPYPYGGWDEPEETDLRRFLHLFWRKKWWLVLGALVGVVAGYFVSDGIQPVYESRATVWVESGSRQSGPIQAEEVLEGRGWSDLFVSLAVLQPVVHGERLFLTSGDAERDSTLFADVSIDDGIVPGEYRLTVDSDSRFELTATTGGEVIQRGSVGDSIGSAIGLRWAPTPNELRPGTRIEFRLSTPAQAAMRLRENLSVQYSPQSGNLITTLLQWTDPKQGAQIHNAITESFIEVATDLKTQKLREVVQILQEQTSYAAERLQEAELSLENSRVRTITLPTEPQAYPIPGGGMTRDPVFNAYFEKKLEAAQLESDIRRLESTLQSARDGGEVDVLAVQMIPTVGQSPELQSSLQQLTEKTAERRSMLYTYTEEHPAVEEISRQISELRSRIIPGQIAELVGQLRSQLAIQSREIEAQAGELRQIPPRSIDEARQVREMDMAEQLYNNLVVRLKEAELASSTDQPDLQVVDAATPPTSPVSHEGPRMFLMISVAGLALGMVGVLLSDRLDRSFRFPDQISDDLGVPVLGVIPRIPDRESPSGSEAQAVIEAFRSVRAQLTRLRNGGRSVVLVTSPAPRDGKSLVAANLAISYAAINRSTLLVDGDIRRGNAETMFGLPSKPGLTDFLSGRAEIPDIIRSTDVAGLYLLPHGALEDFDPVLLENGRMDELMRELRERFHVVVVDAPPLVAGTDPLVLGERADQILMVLRTGVTDGDLARARLDAVGNFRFPLIGAVLNDVPDSRPYYPYHSSYHYYLEGEVTA